VKYRITRKDFDVDEVWDLIARAKVPVKQKTKHMEKGLF
jgi:hypothetical protein